MMVGVCREYDGKVEDDPDLFLIIFSDEVTLELNDCEQRQFVCVWITKILTGWENTKLKTLTFGLA